MAWMRGPAARATGGIFVSVALAASLSGCGKSHGEGGPPGFGGPAQVSVVTVQRQTLPGELRVHRPDPGLA
jgi:hypothetical protein